MLSDILFVLLLATLFSALLTGPAGWRHPRSSSATGAVMFLLLLLTIGMLASATWVGPVGPAFMEFYWLAPTVTGLLLIFLVLSLAAPAAPKPDWKSPVKLGEASAREAEAAGAAFSIFFWILLLSLLLLAVFGGP